MKRIRICFIHWRLVVGGADTALFDLISLLDKSKFEVTIFVVHPGGELEKKFVDAGIKIEHAYSKFNNNDNLFTKVIYHNQIKRVDTAMSRFGKGLFDILYKNKFDIIVSYHLHPPYDELGFPSFGKKIKYIHGNAILSSSYGETIMRQIDYLPKYDEIICVSESTKRALIEKTGLNDGNISVKYNPINSERIINLSNEKTDLQINEPYICAVGRLSPEKGFLRLIYIHKKLISEGINHKLVIIGDGVQRPDIEKAVQELGVFDSAVLLGNKSNPYTYIRNSKFIVIPSFTEAMPVVAMEALCLGVPIVSSYDPVKELFGNEECGITTKLDDNSLYLGIKKMLTDHSFYNKTCLAAKRRSNFFSAKKMIKTIEKEYLDLLGQAYD